MTWRDVLRNVCGSDHEHVRRGIIPLFCASSKSHRDIREFVRDCAPALSSSQKQRVGMEFPYKYGRMSAVASAVTTQRPRAQMNA